jgi:glycosyltransferase involved in cell wall biosynthesis
LIWRNANPDSENNPNDKYKSVAELSVVIITRNEEHNIHDCIHSALLLSNDVIVVDAGSTDNTIELSKKAGASVIEQEWKGYGYARNLGASKAKNNWIISLDADERITPLLAGNIKNATLEDYHIYRFRRENFLGLHKINFGTAGFDKVIRVYNRLHTSWDLTVVHEKLIGDCTVTKIEGTLQHFSMKDIFDYREKSILYARLSAQKYFQQGKRTGFIKRFISPSFNAVKSYIFQLGFLDGARGFQLSRAIAHYTWLKYEFLHQLEIQGNREMPAAGYKLQNARAEAAVAK